MGIQERLTEEIRSLQVSLEKLIPRKTVIELDNISHDYRVVGGTLTGISTGFYPETVTTTTTNGSIVYYKAAPTGSSTSATMKWVPYLSTKSI